MVNAVCSRCNADGARDRSLLADAAQVPALCLLRGAINLGSLQGN